MEKGKNGGRKCRVIEASEVWLITNNAFFARGTRHTISRRKPSGGDQDPRDWSTDSPSPARDVSQRRT